MKVELILVIGILLVSGVFALNDYADNGNSVQYLNDSGNLTTANAVYYINFSSNGNSNFNIKANNIVLNGLGNSIGEIRSDGFDVSIVNLTASSAIGLNNNFAINSSILGNYNFTNAKISFANVYGEILFSNFNNFSGSDLNSRLVIANNSAYISSLLNGSARISLHGMANRFVRPLMFNDGSLCSDCSNVSSLISGTVVFDVSHNGNYTIRENSSAIDSTSPAISFVSPTDSDGTRKNNRIIAINVTASDPNLASLTINVRDSVGVVSSTTTSSSNNYLYLVDLEPERYTFSATAVDSYGNRANTETRTVIINGTITRTTNLTVSSSNLTKIIVYEPKPTKYAKNLILINFTAQDPSGISSLWYSNGTKNFSYSSPVSINLVNGDYIFKFYSKNNNNVENYTSVQFIVSGTVVANVSQALNRTNVQVVPNSNSSKQVITFSNTQEFSGLDLGKGAMGYKILTLLLLILIAYEAWILRKRKKENGY